MTSSLETTIRALKSIKYNLKDQKMLIKALECLRDTVGNDCIKHTITNNVNSLIMYRDTYGTCGMHPTYADVMDMPKLHTVIYGSPGTGKTLLAKILASIWSSVGLIREERGGSSRGRTDRPVLGGYNVPAAGFQVSFVDYLIVGALALCIYKLVKVSWSRLNLSKLLSLEGKEETLAQLLLVAGLTCVTTLGLQNFRRRLFERQECGKRDGKGLGTKNTGRRGMLNAGGRRSTEEGGTGRVGDADGDSGEAGKQDDEVDVRENFFEKYADILSGDRVLVRSPADFIGKYLGFTAEKTRNLLESSLGKVLFVDEAYGFMPRGDHMYGKEALNEITSFIDAHQGEIVLIFAGYEDKLREGVFEAQKGLDRRFGMHITCSGYSKEELFDMLKNKLSSQGLSLVEESKCFEEFSKGHYIYFAGDIDILTNYLREPLAQLYVVNKATMCYKSPSGASASQSPNSSSSSSYADSGVASELDGSSDWNTSSISQSDEGFEDECSNLDGDALRGILKQSMKIYPSMMRTAVAKINSRKKITGKRTDAYSRLLDFVEQPYGRTH